jgi:hypothetical protein
MYHLVQGVVLGQAGSVVQGWRCTTSPISIFAAKSYSVPKAFSYQAAHRDVSARIGK